MYDLLLLPGINWLTQLYVKSTKSANVFKRLKKKKNTNKKEKEKTCSIFTVFICGNFSTSVLIFFLIRFLNFLLLLFLIILEKHQLLSQNAPS